VPVQRTGERAAAAEHEYARLVERHRDELHAHSRRFLRSPEDAEDALQEALTNAWRALPHFEGRSSLRSWLYRIVTNASLDQIHRRPKRLVPMDFDREGPDPQGREETEAPAAERRYLVREDFERALIVAMRHLTARQRAVLILREALGFSARETAARLEVSVAAANSSLQRARARLDELDGRLSDETTHSLRDGGLRKRVERHAEAWERDNIQALVEMLTAEART
jgi:RNA polymerase sigma factor (sigma-70 family)